MTAPASERSATARSSARPAAHAPAHHADLRPVDVGPRAQESDRGLHVPQRAVVRHPAHELMRRVRFGGDLAAIEVHRQGDVALLREAVGFPFREVVQAPPLVDHEHGRLLAGPSGAARYPEIVSDPLGSETIVPAERELERTNTATSVSPRLPPAFGRRCLLLGVWLPPSVGRRSLLPGVFLRWSDRWPALSMTPPLR